MENSNYSNFTSRPTQPKVVRSDSLSKLNSASMAQPQQVPSPKKQRSAFSIVGVVIVILLGLLIIIPVIWWIFATAVFILTGQIR